MLRPVYFLTFWISFSQLAQAVTSLDEDASPGTHALRFKKAPATWFGFKGVLFDGTVHDKQSDSKYYDRRLAAGGAFGFEQPWAPNLSVRLDLRAEAITRRERMATEPETLVDESYFVGRPNADVTYITPAGLELFGGAMYVLRPGYTQNIDAASLSSENQYSTTSIFVPRFGLTRRGGFGNGGIYYILGTESKRHVTKSASDGSLTYDEPINEPTTAAVFAEFNAYNMAWNFEVAAISGSEGGLHAANGTTLSDDHLRLNLGMSWAGFFKVQLSHQTASYSKSAYMNLDNIPLSSLRFLVGDNALGIWSGMAYLYGRDKQSTPEINANYKVDGFVLLMGVNHAM